jgi:hypothetical protein
MQEIEKQLNDSGIDMSLYGQGKAKTIKDLVKEIEDNETVLVKENGKLLRKVQVGNVEIFYTNKTGDKFILKEDKQVFNDGRERRRAHLSGSLSGKMRVDENPKESIIREIQEELGISSRLDVKEKITETETIESQSYPGLPTCYITNRFTADMTDKDFKLEGYVEKTNSLTTYFVWKKYNG